MLKKKLRSLITAALFVMGLSSSAYAAATIEFYSDNGIYSGVPAGSQPMNAFSFAFSLNNFDLDFADATSPERNKSGRIILNSQWGGWGMVFVNGGGNPISQDLSEYAGGHLRFWLKSTQSLKIEMEYDNGTKTSLNVGSTGGVWVEQVIPLSNFTGLNLSKIRVPFIIATIDPAPAGSSTWYVDHVRWTKPLSGIDVHPASPVTSTGDKRQFTAVGKHSSGEEVIIYPNWSVTGTGNSVAPGKARYTILTSGTGNGTVTATDGSTTKNVNFTITTQVQQQFGLLSETINGVVLDTDSQLLTSFGGGASAPTILDETSSDNREGTKRFKTTIAGQTAAGAFSGWVIQWGLNASTSTFIDMHEYYDGSIRFWFKGPVALQDHLEIGVRSANVAAGGETSKVQLKNYVTFDNTWRPVVIPLNTLAEAPPTADLARTKILISVFCIGNIGASAQEFFMDNVRWDSETPGPLTTLQITPSSTTIPVGTAKLFTAQGLDASGVPLDIYPTWDMPGTSLGTLNPTTGVSTILTVGDSPIAQNPLRAQWDGKAAISSVTVLNIAFTQTFNVYTDAGAGGFVGISQSGGAGTEIGLTELTGGATEGTKFFRSTYTLVSPNAFVNWFVEQENGSRFMQPFAEGWLHFFVRTDRDLEFSIRSDNINPNTNLAKATLSELNIPLDNTWRKVIVPLKYLSDKQSGFDYNQIKTYFSIAAVESQIGALTDQQFDVDNVKWLTASGSAPDLEKIYQGLVDKQHSSGLVRSFDTLPQAVTYDNAVTAMAYTYKKDTAKAKNVFDVYKTKFEAGGFQGFHDEYNVETPATIIDTDRLAGPNAWLLLALVHYSFVTGSTEYNALMAGIATYLTDLQHTSGAETGAIRFGYVGGGLDSTISTEHNLDAYAALKALGKYTGNSTYTIASDNILTWLTTRAYVSASNRFILGKDSGGTSNFDKALDVYSWVPLALDGFDSVLGSVDADFRNQKVNQLNGNLVDGYDFGAVAGQPVDKDAVWLEGTAHMALAYYVVESSITAAFFLNELEKAIFNLSANAQGLTYATNQGTGYGGFQMDSLHAAASSMAWYYFAKRQFNPFRPLPLYAITPKNISDNVAFSSVTFTATVPTGWVRANQYVEVDVQPVTTDVWGVQIYTDNKNPGAPIRHVDLSPGNPNNFDSDPAGLLAKEAGQSTTTVKIPLAWSIKDSTNAAPGAFDPTLTCPGFTGDPQAFQWIFMRDINTPAIDVNGDGDTIDTCDLPAFSNGQTSVVIKNASGIHAVQGGAGFAPSSGKDYLYLESNFTNAAAQTFYSAPIIFEFYTE